MKTHPTRPLLRPRGGAFLNSRVVQKGDVREVVHLEPLVPQVTVLRDEVRNKADSAVFFGCGADFECPAQASAGDFAHASLVEGFVDGLGKPVRRGALDEGSVQRSERRTVFEVGVVAVPQHLRVPRASVFLPVGGFGAEPLVDGCVLLLAEPLLQWL